MRLKILSFVLLVVFTSLLVNPAAAYPLTDAQAKRLEKYIPQTLAKLQRKTPVHVALLGDGVSQGFTHDDNSLNVLKSLHGHFLQGLEREFYYTGGIRLINPLGGHFQKLKDHQGEEISLEQFTSQSATALNALQWLTTTAFMNRPDLVLIHYGANDFRYNSVLDTYKQCLSRAIEICRQSGSEVIIVGPALVRASEEPYGWGGSRLYADAARDVAAENEVMFLDPGLVVGAARPAPDQTEAAEASTSVSEALAMEFFDYGPEHQENFFMNSRAHQLSGRTMFEQFLNGATNADYGIEATATYAKPNLLRVRVGITNKGQETKFGALAPLQIGSTWIPEQPFLDLEVSPGKTQHFDLSFRRKGSDSGDGSSLAPQRGNDRFLPLSFLLSDLDRTILLDVRAPLGPVSVVWDLKPRQSRGGTFPLRFTVRNPGEKAVSGSYELNYSNQRARGTFSLSPKEAKDFSAQCGLPRDQSVLRSRDVVRLRIESGPSSFVFERELEATRDLSLASAVQLSRLDRYFASKSGPAKNEKPSTLLKTKADPSHLEFTLEVDGARLEENSGQASILLSLGLDARPKDEIHSLGFIEPMEFEFQPDQPRGTLRNLPAGAFGNGYAKEIDPNFIEASLTATKDRSDHHLIKIRIPRSYLYRHEWKLGSPGCQIGLSANLQMLRVDPVSGDFGYPENHTWCLTTPNPPQTDPRSLVSMELRTRNPIGWSVRLR